MKPTTKPKPKPKPKPTDTRLRVLRGGGWYDSFEPSWVSAASRGTGVPASRGGDLGFRTHLSVRQPRV